VVHTYNPRLERRRQEDQSQLRRHSKTLSQKKGGGGEKEKGKGRRTGRLGSKRGTDRDL
jgi:hypothetical protein